MLFRPILRRCQACKVPDCADWKNVAQHPHSTDQCTSICARRSNPKDRRDIKVTVALAVAIHPGYTPAMTIPAAIAVDKLVKSYHGTRAVGPISFTVPRGSVVGLLGGNGAGKTTTISMIMGLTLPDEGSIHVLGEPMPEARTRILHRINFESPYVDMPHRLTVRQNLRVFGMLYGMDRIGERIERLSDQFDLTRFLDRPSGKLSAGQKTRVALAKALINDPDVLLLDEPTASLDPDTADWVRSRLEEYKRNFGASILLASHNMPEVERLCDTVLMLKQGRIVDQGSPSDLIERYGRADLEQVFLDVARGRGEGALLGDAQDTARPDLEHGA